MHVNRDLFRDSPSLRVRDVVLGPDDDVQRHREKLARIVLDEMYQFVALLDAEGTLLEVNRAALEGAGIRLEEIQGKPFWEARWWTVSRETQAQQREACALAAAGEFVRYDVEIYGQASGEGTIIIDYSLIPVKDRDGKVVFLLPEGRNITEKKRAEAEIARKNQELQRLLDRVRELDELKSQFFANVSHELRTPLALILGPAERMLGEGDNLTPQQRRDLEVMRRNAATLLKHVNDLLDISRLDAGKMAADYVEADLAVEIRQVAAHFDALAPQRNIAWVLDVPESVPAQVDTDKVDRILLNLLSNAFKFTPDGGRIRCSLAVEGGRALIAIQDSGPGVPPAVRDTIFERFRQAEDSSTRKFGGTGLGLAIAKDFVDLHGGTIAVSDAPGGGALFQVTLPLTAPEGVFVRKPRRGGAGEGSRLGAGAVLDGTLTELQPTRRPEREEAVAAPASEGWPTVLVVEDHPDLRRFIAETLEDRYRVVTAENGRIGLDTAVVLRPDLIVSDIMMPEMSGDRMIAALRRNADLAEVPILVLSAKADDALRVRLLREGAQDYLVKPFSAEELLARVAIQVAIKRTRDILRTELASQRHDIEHLARDLAVRNREFRDAADAMRIARDQAERASQAKGEFLRLVSHELRTPLMNQTLNLYMLRRLDLSPESLKILDQLEASTERLASQVDALLEFSRSQAGGLTAQPAAFDAAALVVEVVDTMRPRAEAKGLALRLDGGGAAVTARSDPTLVRHVLLNLVDNAIKYTHRGEVVVRIAGGGGLTLSVADTGVGIAPEDQTRIFDPFVQLESVRHKHGSGVGLGLALVREMVAALGGSMTLDSTVGAGTMFTVALPELPLPGAA